MSALAAARQALVLRGTIKKTVYQLKIGTKAWEGGIACIDTAAAGFILPAVAGSTTLIPIGFFINSVDASAGALPVGVDLFREKNVAYYDTVTGAGAVTSANMFQELYLASDHELTTTQGSNSAAGRMWSISPSGNPGAIGVEAPFGNT